MHEPASGAVPAPPTLFEGDLLSGEDEVVGASRLWRLTGERKGVARIVPDLCHDLLWLPDKMPVILERTIEPLTTHVSVGAIAHGVRFGPAVVSVHVDWSWAGWRRGLAGDRRAALRNARSTGALAVQVDRRLEAVLSLLDRPHVRIPRIAEEFGVSERQLLRWTTAGLDLTPKQIHRQLRVRRFSAADPRLTLAERSIDAGFYDQAHAANEIRSVTGLSAATLAGLTMADTSKTAA